MTLSSLHVTPTKEKRTKKIFLFTGTIGILTPNLLCSSLMEKPMHIFPTAFAPFALPRVACYILTLDPYTLSNSSYQELERSDNGLWKDVLNTPKSRFLIQETVILQMDAKSLNKIVLRQKKYSLWHSIIFLKCPKHSPNWITNSRPFWGCLPSQRGEVHTLWKNSKRRLNKNTKKVWLILIKHFWASWSCCKGVRCSL